MTVEKAEADLLEKGWSVFQLPDPSPIKLVASSFLALLRELTGYSAITLETYHEYIKDDKEHFSLQSKLAAHARNEGFAKQIVLGQLAWFQAILGPDISITTSSTWRLARPNKKQDNVGFHRDLDLGFTGFELNLWFPFVDVDEGSAINVMGGSHLMSREKFPYQKAEHPSIKKGSAMNKLGFFYAPLVYESWFRGHMTPVPMNAGQGLMFFPPTMHGQEVNRGHGTRWSTDFVIANSFAPIDRTHHGNEPKFETICESTAMKIGRTFHPFP